MTPQDIHVEKTKLRASLFNNLATASFAGVVIGASGLVLRSGESWFSWALVLAVGIFMTCNFHKKAVSTLETLRD